MGEYVDGRLDSRRAGALEKHVRHCAACSAALEAMQRGSGAVSKSQAGPSVPLNAQTLLGTHYSLPRERGAGRSRTNGLVPMAVLLLLFALVGSIAAMSWFLGAPAAQGAPERDPAESWNTSARSLDAGALNQLRQAGWTCPVIEAAGFSLSSATGVLDKGEATVTLVLSDDVHIVELAETRALAGAQDVPLKKSMAASASTDPTSGMLTELGHRLGAKAAAAVTYAEGTATLSMDGVRYEVSSDLSKADVERVLQRLVVGEHTRIVSLDPSTEKFSQRLLRGFSRLMVLDFK
ncbi:zf-HC2 domain-containing protein [Paeniglutamicibacter sp. MACA_103]|uniref:zf-HC2 domain-containing protein n=1 Tax=Paeniglutamicibacter sp. MACA_103 TaxID=3377337 RepID=UPI0038943398